LGLDVRSSVWRIVIREDHASGYYQPCHAQGLIRWCKENPSLRVETQVDLWRVISWPASHCHLNVQTVLGGLATWISEASLLRDLGMLSNAYTLVFRSPSASATQHIYDTTKRAAAIQVAVKQHQLTHPDDDEYLLFYEILFGDYVTIMKEVVAGDSIVRFDADMGEPWDLQDVVAELDQRGLALTIWKDVIPANGFEHPPQGWEAMWKEDVIDIKWGGSNGGLGSNVSFGLISSEWTTVRLPDGFRDKDDNTFRR
ncbi:hypothetical protein K458DRAFT_286433, partial [Lentithecium fluviatile CBS 122367]